MPVKLAAALVPSPIDTAPASELMVAAPIARPSAVVVMVIAFLAAMELPSLMEVRASAIVTAPFAEASMSYTPPTVVTPFSATLPSAAVIARSPVVVTF